MESFKEFIEIWMRSFVERPNPLLGNWAPCPFARKVRLESKVSYVYVEPELFESSVREACRNISDKYEVLIVGTLPSAMTPDELVGFSRSCRKAFEDQDIWPLFDHPEEKEVVNGICMNNGRYLLAMIQKKSKLDNASRELFKAGYYDVWDSQSYDEVVGPRLNWLRRRDSNPRQGD